MYIYNVIQQTTEQCQRIQTNKYYNKFGNKKNKPKTQAYDIKHQKKNNNKKQKTKDNKDKAHEIYTYIYIYIK